MTENGANGYHFWSLFGRCGHLGTEEVAKNDPRGPSGGEKVDVEKNIKKGGRR